jgi:hypothetical protein
MLASVRRAAGRRADALRVSPAYGPAGDAYAATHGGDGSQRRDRQSVCLHLMADLPALETDRGPEARMTLLREMTATKVDWPTLRRPLGIPSLNLQHAAAAVSQSESRMQPAHRNGPEIRHEHDASQHGSGAGRWEGAASLQPALCRFFRG